MVKMKKCFNDDDNGYDDNGADVKVKRAFKKPDCAGTQGAAAPSPSAQLSRIQPLQLPLLQPLLQLHTTTTTITTTTTSIITTTKLPLLQTLLLPLPQPLQLSLQGIQHPLLQLTRSHTTTTTNT